jgi:hypothetical protein
MNAMNGSSSPLQALARLKKSYGPLFGFIPKEEMQKVCQLSVTEWGSLKS